MPDLPTGKVGLSVAPDDPRGLQEIMVESIADIWSFDKHSSTISLLTIHEIWFY